MRRTCWISIGNIFKMKTFKRILEILTPYERRQILRVLLLFIVLALLEAAGLASIMPFLAVLGNPELIETNPMLRTLWSIAQSFSIDSKDKFLVALGVTAFLLILFAALYRGVAQYINNYFVEMCRHGISKRVLETYLHQPYSFFLNRHSGDLSKTILSEVDNIIERVVRPTILMISNSVVLLALVALLVVVNPLLVLLAVGLIGVLYVVIYAVLRKHIARFGEILVEANKKRFTAAGEALGGIKSIKLFGREAAYLDRFNSPSMQYSWSHAGHNTLGIIPSYVVEVVVFGAILLLTLSLIITSGGVQSDIMGQILPIIGLYTFAAYRMKPVVQAIYQGVAGLRFGGALVDNLHRELSLDKPVSIHETASRPQKLRQNILLENLTFSYPGADRPSLDDISLNIPAKSSLGLVGTTGAGKTTLVDLILGLLQPSRGGLVVDGKPVTLGNLRSWQKSLGYVPQDIFLSDTTIAENIALGIPKREIDYEQVVRCARSAQLDSFIMQELPDRYETVVGERGVRLSGGQRQRIGIARALYHNPEVLIFDEATSALDTVTEQAVMDAIDTLAHQKTMILIAHRLSTVRHCDQIVLLDKGRVKAVGSFDELKDINDHFRELAGV